MTRSEDQKSEDQKQKHVEFLRLYVEHEEALRGFVRALVPTREDARDVMQEVTVVLWRKIDELSAMEDFRRWAFSVARMQALTFLRDCARDRHVFGDDVLALLADEAEADAEVFEAERIALEECLGKLDAAQRALVDAAYAPGVRLDVLAASAGRSAMSLYKALHRIRPGLDGLHATSARAEGVLMSSDQQRLELVRSYVDRTATAEETQALEDALGTDAAFRHQYLRYLNVDAALGNGRLSGVAGGVHAPVGQRQARWLSRRPVIAAAVGLVFGLFCASVAWAVIGTRATGARINVALLDESFENSQMNWPEGFPVQAGSWSGERGQVVGGIAELQPKDGKLMLRLDPAAATTLSYLDQVIDLRSHPLPEGDELRQIEVTASFHAATPGKRERYTLRVATFGETPDQIEPLWVNVPWKEMDQRTLTLAKRGVSTLADASGWQTITVTVEAPREARSVVISLASGRLKRSDEKMPHYLDDVRARLLIGSHTTHPKTRLP